MLVQVEQNTISGYRVRPVAILMFWWLHLYCVRHESSSIIYCSVYTSWLDLCFRRIPFRFRSSSQLLISNKLTRGDMVQRMKQSDVPWCGALGALVMLYQCSSGAFCVRRTRIFVRMPCGEILPADMDLNWTTWQASEYIIATWLVERFLLGTCEVLMGGIYELGEFGGLPA